MATRTAGARLDQARSEVSAPRPRRPRRPSWGLPPRLLRTLLRLMLLAIEAFAGQGPPALSRVPNPQGNAWSVVPLGGDVQTAPGTARLRAAWRAPVSGHRATARRRKRSA